MQSILPKMVENYTVEEIRVKYLINADFFLKHQRNKFCIDLITIVLIRIKDLKSPGNSPLESDDCFKNTSDGQYMYWMKSEFSEIVGIFLWGIHGWFGFSILKNLQCYQIYRCTRWNEYFWFTLIHKKISFKNLFSHIFFFDVEVAQKCVGVLFFHDVLNKDL